MFPNNIEFFGRERHQERFQDIEHIRLAKIARPQQFRYGEVSRKIARWLGEQMVKGGARLQSYGSAPLSKVSSVETVG
jgi:hypothetical protein